MRQKFEEAVQGREEQLKSSEAVLAEVRSQCTREVERCRQEADRAREDQLREKEGFDIQVSILQLALILTNYMYHLLVSRQLYMVCVCVYLHR